LNTVEISGQDPVTLPPVCLPYSPEFAPDQPGRGATALAQIATTTGGKERVEIPKLWDELPVRSRYVELAPWLLVLGTKMQGFRPQKLHIALKPKFHLHVFSTERRV
jgi:hypothetical protein